jgi:hypothetical protein
MGKIDMSLLKVVQLCIYALERDNISGALNLLKDVERDLIAREIGTTTEHQCKPDGTVQEHP